MNALGRAVLRNDTPSIQAYLERGGNANARVRTAGGDEFALLHLATAYRQDSIVDLLIRSGADPSITDPVGLTPLHYAAAANDARLTDRLVHAGAAIDRADAAGRTPLHVSAQFAAGNALSALLAEGADPTRTNKHGRTPAEVAVARGQVAVIDVLLTAQRVWRQSRDQERAIVRPTQRRDDHDQSL